MLTDLSTRLSVTFFRFQSIPAAIAPLRSLRPFLSIASVLVDQPVADQTGISAALIALAKIGVGFLAGALTIYVVIQGYQYMSTDESTRGVHLKHSLGALLGGAILVLVAVTIAPQLVNAVVTGNPNPPPPNGGNTGTA